jgi:hypothetical protein
MPKSIGRLTLFVGIFRRFVRANLARIIQLCRSMTVRISSAAFFATDFECEVCEWPSESCARVAGDFVWGDCTRIRIPIMLRPTSTGTRYRTVPGGSLPASL